MRSIRVQTIVRLYRSTNDKFYLLRFVPLASALKDEAKGARCAKNRNVHRVHEDSEHRVT